MSSGEKKLWAFFRVLFFPFRPLSSHAPRAHEIPATPESEGENRKGGTKRGKQNERNKTRETKREKQNERNKTRETKREKTTLPSPSSSLLIPFRRSGRACRAARTRAALRSRGCPPWPWACGRPRRSATGSRAGRARGRGRGLEVKFFFVGKERERERERGESFFSVFRRARGKREGRRHWGTRSLERG